jgi:hypothetical protein
MTVKGHVLRTLLVGSLRAIAILIVGVFVAFLIGEAFWYLRK